MQSQARLKRIHKKAVLMFKLLGVGVGAGEERRGRERAGVRRALEELACAVEIKGKTMCFLTSVIKAISVEGRVERKEHAENLLTFLCKRIGENEDKGKGERERERESEDGSGETGKSEDGKESIVCRYRRVEEWTRLTAENATNMEKRMNAAFDEILAETIFKQLQ